MRARLRGFTLIELLVAIGLLALMAALSWRGLDGMTRAQAQMRQHSDEVLALQAGLAQWGADLDALALQPNTPSLDWDGRALRILRRGTATPGAGLSVVAWSRRNVDGVGQWLRWQSPPLRTRGELELAWQTAAAWAQNPGDEERQREVRIAPLDQWQIFYYRGDAWSNPLSSEGAAGAGQAPSTAVIPDGVRLVLTLSAGQAISGVVTRDWVRPTVGGGK
ncbi:MAG: prepilin-type N-terminal cleavage/methylation domain-containing protein [Rhodoferax sp.]|uniref:PulJ/GspJ family protein n=1 Tax=Rhodoferax sp. TaxID=50421 RepID=UPI002617DE7F|nr:prepilin-type N-terminal cleavage/methylation domain-containing protein [Rhodoferax sp.]MDD5334636.1 prepilin-type N-terminal cleavage/methylation domain-containing protein [Rhodoferax sp.]